MRVKSPILPGNFFVSIDINDKRVTQHSRHTIAEAGLGHMIEGCLAQWERDRKRNKTTVKTDNFLCNGKACHRVELIRLENNRDCPRTVIYLEKESKLPVRLDNYDWPRERSGNWRPPGIVQLRQPAVQRRPEGRGFRQVAQS